MKKKLSIVISLVILLFCTFGYLVAPNNPNQTNLTVKLIEPDGAYFLGTDSLGRCVFSRLLYGGRTTLGIVLLGAIVIFIIGTPLGVLLSNIFTKNNVGLDGFINAVTAIPPVAYLIVFIGAWGNGIKTMILAMAVSFVLRYVKLVRSKADIELQKAYVMCAIASGATKGRVMFAHVLPNILGDLIQFICLSCADMVMVITGYSFIGLGMGDTVIDWGSMMLDARAVMYLRPNLILYPLTLIIACTICFNVLGRMVKRR